MGQIPPFRYAFTHLFLNFRLNIPDCLFSKFVTFNNRTKEDIDDIIYFFESKGGVTKFNFIIPNSNEGSSEETIKVVCDTWKKTFTFGDYYSATATFRRVYEA